MSRQDFINELRAKLSDLQNLELEDRLSFYNEMIDDRIEEGLTEEAAVAEIGSVELVAARIREELSSTVCEVSIEIEEDADGDVELGTEKNIAKKKVASRIIFWAGSPIWLALAVALPAVVLALYVSLWAVVASLWVAFAACTLSAPLGVVISVFNIVSGDSSALFMIASALVCAGIAIFAFFGALYATRGSSWLTKYCINYLKKFHREVA